MVSLTVRPDSRFRLPVFRCGLILREVAVIFRHARNIATFRYANRQNGISGRIWTEKWLIYRMSAIELFSFVTVFLIAYLFTGSVAFLGGAVRAAITAVKHLWWSRKTATPKGQLGAAEGPPPHQ